MNAAVLDLPLFRAAARRTDPATSKEAAATVDAATLAGRVLDTLRESPAGLTSHEIADRMDLSLVTVSPRMKPLETAGLVVRAGRRDRRTIWSAV